MIVFQCSAVQPTTGKLDNVTTTQQSQYTTVKTTKEPTRENKPTEKKSTLKIPTKAAKPTRKTSVIPTAPAKKSPPTFPQNPTNKKTVVTRASQNPTRKLTTGSNWIKKNDGQLNNEGNQSGRSGSRNSAINGVGIGLIILSIVIIISALCWFVYAYQHPQSRSGRFLIEVRIMCNVKYYMKYSLYILISLSQNNTMKRA